MVIFFLLLYTVIFLVSIKQNNANSNSVDKILSIKQYELIRDTIDGARK